MANKTMNARIQLKCDTEANWSKALNFTPQKGEAIIYSADSTHPFSRLKVGDGSTNVNSLPFIDASTVEGKTISAAAEKGVDTSISAGSTSINLPTSAAVAAFVEGKGYTTNAVNSTNSTDKLFFVGATSQVTTPQTYSNEEVYGTNGTLNATVIQIAEKAQLKYNTTDNSIDFIFI